MTSCSAARVIATHCARVTANYQTIQMSQPFVVKRCMAPWHQQCISRLCRDESSLVGIEATRLLAGHFPQRRATLGLDGAALEITAQDARARGRAWQVGHVSSHRVPCLAATAAARLVGTCQFGSTP